MFAKILRRVTIGGVVSETASEAKRPSEEELEAERQKLRERAAKAWPEGVERISPCCGPPEGVELERRKRRGI